MSSNKNIDDVIRSFILGPRRDVHKCGHYYINNYNFHTSFYGRDKSTMNYGVYVKGIDGVEYHRILQEVIELMYVGSVRIYKTMLFKCDWFDSANGLNIHQHYELVDANHTSKYPKYNPFVLIYQMAQVCSTRHPTMKNDKNQRWVVLKMKLATTYA